MALQPQIPFLGPKLWEAEQILEIPNQAKENIFTCVGFAPTRGRRCQNRIAIHNRVMVRDTLDLASRFDPDNPEVERLLRRVVGRALCFRHVNQEPHVLRNWMDRVEDLAIVRLRAELGQEPAPHEQAVPAAPVQPAPCNRRHARRKPTDDACQICLASTTHTARRHLVWCKTTCGTNYHASCWALWTAAVPALGRGLFCPYCLTAWSGEACEHDIAQAPAGGWDMWTAGNDEEALEEEAGPRLQADGLGFDVLYDPEQHLSMREFMMLLVKSKGVRDMWEMPGVVDLPRVVITLDRRRNR
ncbi:hypothetical protein BDY21DRAFT_381509 [Lineolata rhizophorae]|uniref:RING-type domain-containing protein n=1 Tax=Lineolata rhizophorae TaxID=578093 RepID=A0A6A6NR06_9PEZI|nr:hypothetical protein BDY21DRAFT_381509 [Lineolata rhizophorae]